MRRGPAFSSCTEKVSSPGNGPIESGLTDQKTTKRKGKANKDLIKFESEWGGG